MDMKTPHIDPNILKNAPAPIVNKFAEKRESVLHRFPLLFTMLATFGLVSTFYGFERIIDRVDFFSDYPISLLITGLLTLIFTGTLYKKLG
jgi:hypothetical protein